jgi:DDE family transposase
MSYTSKSPVDVARVALRVATQALPRYAHRFSPKKFTQPQLFACLVLKAFFKTDYRGVAIYLEDLPELARRLGLRVVPHWTTLQKAGKRLLTLPTAGRLLTATVQRCLGRRRRVRRAAFDSTGLACGHASSYYVRRRAKGGKGWQETTYKRFAKLEAAFDCDSHLIIGAIPRRGPSVDVDRFVPLLEQVLRRVRPQAVLADAGYDSEPNHRHARERRGVRSVIPAEIGRPSPKPPAGRWRRRMRARLDKDYCQYGQRWQAETGFSMIKRRLGSEVGARNYWSQCRELMLLAVVHNLLILVG